MHELYKLKENLCKELEEYSNKELTSGNLEVIDKLSRSIDKLCKIIEYCEEDEYSSRNMSYARGANQYGSYRGRSYARGGSYARRDSMGRYSRDGGYSNHGSMVEELREMMEEAPNEHTRQEFQRFIAKIESM